MDEVVTEAIEVVFTKSQAIRFAVSCYAGGLGMGLAIGGYIGYRYAKSKLTEEFEQQLELEKVEADRLARMKHKVDEYSDPEVLAAKYPETEDIVSAARAMINYQGASKQVAEDAEIEVGPEGVTATVPSEGPEVVVQTVFPPIPGEPNYSEEIMRRNPEFPYIISYDEFNANETNFTQTNLTYFEGDGVLANEQEMPIENVDELVGEDNLMHFGQWAKDKNMLYVRNERFMDDFEIARHPGNYGEAVAGFLEHSYDPGPKRRFQRGDDE